jgi:DNA-binding Lrp family transcriptional regulator
MVTAIVLLHTEPGAVGTVAETLAGLEGVAEVYSVAGEWDLVAIVRVRRNEDLADLITSRISSVEGILSTETLIAFRAYSRHDLERIFSIGMDG